MKNLLLITLFFNFYFSYAQVGIGTTQPDSSAALDVYSDEKGILIPRVNLSSEKDKTTIAKPADGLLAFSTGKAGLKEGLYYWSAGSDQWVSTLDANNYTFDDGEPGIDSLHVAKFGARYRGSSDQIPIFCLLLTCTPTVIKWASDSSSGGLAEKSINFDDFETSSRLLSADQYELVVPEDGVYIISANITMFPIQSTYIHCEQAGINSELSIFLMRNARINTGFLLEGNSADYVLAKESIAFGSVTILTSTAVSMSTSARLYRGDRISVGAGLSILNSGLDLSYGFLVPGITPDAQSLSLYRVGN